MFYKISLMLLCGIGIVSYNHFINEQTDQREVKCVFGKITELVKEEG